MFARKICLGALVSGWALTLMGQTPPAGGPDFQSQILPILSDRCFSCHGPDSQANESGLRLDVRGEAVGELPSGEGFAIVPGHPERSQLLRRIRHRDPDLRMPPAAANRKVISEAETELLQAWIAGGAPYQTHWSFEPLPDQVAVPKVLNSDGCRNEIDHFVRAELERQGRQPAAEAERWRWLRRVTLDLTGLPPSPEEQNAFAEDASPQAYETVVDRLLNSPAFGEHFAVAWLDAVRYGDSYGYQSDQLCQVWPYRDFVVSALNRNMPYDQFLTWQLAGDLLPNATREQRLATAFNRLHRQTNEGGSLDEEWRAEYAADRVQTFGTAVLGLTLECARCHDHKFDPISTREYYQLVAFFNSIDEHGMYNDAGHVPTPSLMLYSGEAEKKLSELQARRDQWMTPSPEASLARGEPPAERAGTRYSFDLRNERGEFPAEPADRGSATSSDKNTQVTGFAGQAIQFSGDDGVSIPAFALTVHQPFTLAFRLRLPESFRNGMVWHQTSGTDTGFSGTEMTLVDGRLRLAMVRFWPGNAIAVETPASVACGDWVSIVASYDGSGRAAGLKIWIDGQQASQTLRDHLYKSPNTGDRITLGERFRTLGLSGGAIDELFISQACYRPGLDGELEPDPDAIGSEARDRIRQIFEIHDATEELMVMEELPQPRETYVLERGRYDAPRLPDRLVARGVPAALPRWLDAYPPNRLGLAQWLVEPQHPLTARVAVNRIWQNFFGRGLVETAEDFGLQGSRPSHPQLLDWLARDFVQHGWDLKRLCRQIALSATYRQTSRVSAAERAADPSNRSLARGPAHRLSAEQLRDLALAASGLLETRRGGPPVSPRQPEGLWTESNSMSPAYRPSVDRDLHRRSLYSVWKRTAPLPNMLAFDAAGREVCAVRRSQTHTPTQALVLLNDPEFVGAAAHAAVTGGLPVEQAADQRLATLFSRFAGRQPTVRETEILLETWKNQQHLFAENPADAQKLLAAAGLKIDPSWTPEHLADLAAWTVLVQTVLNSDAVVWKR